MSGDIYKRTWNGNKATCGCRWVRRRTGPVRGDVLMECPPHAAEGEARLMVFEAVRAGASR